MSKKQNRELIKEKIQEPIKGHMRFLIDAENQVGVSIIPDVSEDLTDTQLINCSVNALECLVGFVAEVSGMGTKGVIATLIQSMYSGKKEDKTGGKFSC